MRPGPARPGGAAGRGRGRRGARRALGGRVPLRAGSSRGCSGLRRRQQRLAAGPPEGPGCGQRRQGQGWGRAGGGLRRLWAGAEGLAGGARRGSVATEGRGGLGSARAIVPIRLGPGSPLRSALSRLLSPPEVTPRSSRPWWLWCCALTGRFCLLSLTGRSPLALCCCPAERVTSWLSL